MSIFSSCALSMSIFSSHICQCPLVLIQGKSMRNMNVLASFLRRKCHCLSFLAPKGRCLSHLEEANVLLATTEHQKTSFPVPTRLMSVLINYITLIFVFLQKKDIVRLFSRKRSMSVLPSLRTSLSVFCSGISMCIFFHQRR